MQCPPLSAQTWHFFAVLRDEKRGRKERVVCDFPGQSAACWAGALGIMMDPTLGLSYYIGKQSHSRAQLSLWTPNTPLTPHAWEPTACEGEESSESHAKT